MLVCRDIDWVIAIRDAVAAVGGMVATVGARDAVTRLAGAEREFTHLLIHPDAAEGLAHALSDLVDSGGEMALLTLGKSDSDRPEGGGIAVADRQAIIAALATTRLPAVPARPALSASELLDIIDARMIETHYQPIVRLEDRAVTSVEVLARLNHPAHGTLTPDWFVSRFEAASLAFILTGIVSTLAFADRTSPDFPRLAIALNYPLNVLSHPAVAADLDAQREAWRLPAEDVVIELTESLPVEDFPALTRALELLRAKGYRISIDDVGPAVKHIDRLLTLPFTGLKLDKCIVDRIGTDHPGASEASRLVEKARSRGLNVVAEGVETWAMWDRLRALGVPEVQGFLVSRPLPAAALPVWRMAWDAGFPHRIQFAG
jgi:EAL domain-containing protein (putative c-di-GMP-specific phosphodiesterase class I)